MRLNSQRIYIRKLESEDIKPLLDLRIRNRQFHQPFEPLRPDSHYTFEEQEEIVEKVQLDWANGSGFGFGIFMGNGDNTLIGRVNLSNVVRGAWESCTIGYFLDETFCGQGLATEAVTLAVKFAFEDANLHRVQGAVMPRNESSIRVLEKVGFRYEGYAEYYLNINGIWEHHNIYSLTRENWDGVFSHRRSETVAGIDDSQQKEVHRMKNVYVIRHCKAEGQAADARLTELGQRQAEQLSEFLMPINIDFILSSPYERAYRTIAPLAEKLGIEVVVDDRLAERVLSTENHPDWLNRLRRTFEDLDVCYEGGESSRNAMARVVAVVKEALNSEFSTIAIVSHGNLISLLLKHFEERIGFEVWEALSNPDVFRLSFTEDSPEIERIWRDNS